MKKFLLSLLAILCSVGMWAEDETIYDFAQGIGTTDGETGKPAAFTGNTSFKLSGNAQYIIISPLSGSFKNGDKIEITGSCGTAGKNMGLYFATAADGRTAGVAVYTTAETKNQSYTATGTLTLSEDASSLYLFRYESTSTTITGLKITRESSKTASDLTVSSSTASVNINATTDVTYTTSSTGTVSVASTDENIATATLDATNNKVTITGIAEGTATITLTQAADDNYLSGSKTITVTVVAPTTIDFTPRLISFTENDVTKSAGLDGLSFSDGEFKITITDTNSKFVIDANNAYFGTSGDDKVQYSYRMKTSAKSSSSNSITVTIPSDGILKIYARTGSSSATDRNIVLSQSGTTLIDHIMLESEAVTETYTDDTGAEATRKIYPILSSEVTKGTASITYPTAAIYLYAFEFIPKLADITVSAAGYATYYNSASAYIMPKGMTGKTAAVDAGALTLTDTYTEGSVVPAGEPLVLKAEAGDYVLYAATTDATASEDNALLGTDEETALTNDNDYYYYALSLNAASELSSIGFYWMNETGAAFTNGAHKAYLTAPKEYASKVRGFAFNGEATAINAVETATPAEDVIFDMTGRRVKTAKAGLYIVNGVKKYIK